MLPVPVQMRLQQRYKLSGINKTTHAEEIIPGVGDVLVLRVLCCALILSTLCECCISFSMTSYKRCDSLPNCEANFIKRFYPIYYNVIPYISWQADASLALLYMRAGLSGAWLLPDAGGST